MSLLKQNITKKRQAYENLIELNVGNSKKYKTKAIWNNKIYTKELEDYLSSLYYLIE